MSRIGASALTLVLAVLLAVTATTDEVALVAATVVVIQALIASAPNPADARGRSVPTPRFVPALAAGLVASLIAVRPELLDGAEGTTAVTADLISGGVLAGIIPACAVGVILTLVSQMLRKDGRPSLVTSTGYAVTLVVFSALSAGWIGAAQGFDGTAMVIIGASGLAAAMVVWAVPGPRIPVAFGAVVAGASASGIACHVVDSVATPVYGVLVGSTVAVFGILGQVLGRAWSRGRRHASAGWGFPGAASLALASPVVYISGQLIALLL